MEHLLSNFWLFGLFLRYFYAFLPKCDRLTGPTQCHIIRSSTAEFYSKLYVTNSLTFCCSEARGEILLKCCPKGKEGLNVQTEKIELQTATIVLKTEKIAKKWKNIICWMSWFAKLYRSFLIFIKYAFTTIDSFFPPSVWRPPVNLWHGGGSLVRYFI